MKRKIIGWLLCIVMAGIFAGCGNGAKETGSDGVENTGDMSVDGTEQMDIKKVAVFLSGSETEETLKTQELFVTELEEKGHEVSVLLADGDAAVQVEQIEQQLDDADVFVIEPVDAYGLTEVLAKVSEQEIPVIAYDDLIMDTADVSYYTTYSYRNMGQMVGEAIKEAKKLDDAVKDQVTYNMEFLMGSQDSLEALFFYNGVMEILKEYFDAGVLVCPSGRDTFDENGILRWDGEQAKLRLQECLGIYEQSGAAIDIVCTGFDSAAISAVEVLEEAGYVSGSEGWPLITGLGCETEAMNAITQGKLYCSIYMDEAEMVQTCVKMADACVKGEEVDVNDSVQYDNGVKIVEANVCEAKLIMLKNVDDLSESDAGTDSEGVTEDSAEESENASVNEQEDDSAEASENTDDEALDSMSAEDFQ